MGVPHSDTYSFPKRVAIAAFILLLMVATFYMLGKYSYYFLLVFAGILLSVLFNGISEWFEDKFKMKHGIALFLAVLLVFGILIGAFVLISPKVSKQVHEMQQTIPNSIDKVQTWLEGFGLGKKLIDKVPNDVSDLLPKPNSILIKVSSFFSATLSIVADILIVIVTALFLAASPTLYTKGFARLFPVNKRNRVMEVLYKCYSTLKQWLLAMLLAMTIIGVSTAIGYSLIGLPLALTLGIISFLFAFVPNIGPWIAAIPAVLIGLTINPQLALYALLIYSAIQIVESYVITPLIFQRTVNLPPALLLFFQVLMGMVLGAIGLLLAAPLLAVLMVVVKELYIKDVLEKGSSSDSDNLEPKAMRS